MNAYKIHVCRPFENGDRKGMYRFMVIDPNDDRGYPANYVCMLPQKIYDTGKPLSVFARKFGDNSLEVAVKLVETAILQVKDAQMRIALEKRLKSLTSTSVAKSFRKVAHSQLINE
jgi:hypothetical protein